MWDARFAHPQGRLSLRNFLSFATALLVVSFLYIFFQAPTAYAADATWVSGGILYKDNIYKGPVSSEDTPSINLPDATTYYIYTEPADSSTTQTKAHVIYFAPGNDPGDSTSATYRTYNITGANSFSNPSDTTTISLEADPGVNSSGELEATSCDVGFGIGWLVCGISKGLAWSVDKVFEFIKGFLVVRPLSSDTDNAIYRAWVISRSFANIMFVIAFLFLIYSQMTNLGMGNYGIKKMLPKIIVAAVLVNVSYWICAVAVDISNILGESIQKILIDIRGTMIGNEGGYNWDLMNWENLMAYILSGGAAAGAVFAGLHIMGAGAVGTALGNLALFMLPLLLLFLLSVIVVFLILAARQAIITIFIIISPIAFILYLLPSTEKWLDKWRSIFTTMLIMFPAFSLLFGGSQLASAAIIQNATSLYMVILALGIQVVPLAITPFLLKLGGGLLNRFAGIVNNPAKGLVDRTRNWSNEQIDQNKAAALRRSTENTRLSPDKRWGRGGRMLSSRARSLHMHNQGQDRKERKENDELAYSNYYHRRSAARTHDIEKRDLNQSKQMIEDQNATNWNSRINPTGPQFNSQAYADAISARATADTAKLATERVDTAYEEAKAGKLPQAPIAGPVMNDIQGATILAENTARDIALTAIRKSQAGNEISSDINKALLASSDLQKYAAGIGDHELMLAGVVAKDRKEYGEHVGAQQQLMKHFKLESSDYQDIAMSKGDIIKTDSNGNTHTFTFKNEYSKEAAIETQFKAGSYGQKMEIVNESGLHVHDIDAQGNVTIREGVNYAHRSTIQDVVISSGFNASAPFVNDKSFDQILKGEWKGPLSMAAHSLRQIMEGRVKAEGIVRGNGNALKLIYELGDLKSSTNSDDIRKFELYKQTFLDMIPDQATREATARSFDSMFEENYRDALVQARNIMETPLLLKEVNKEAKDVFRRYAERAGYVDPNSQA